MRFVRFPQLKAEKGIPWSRMHIDREEKAGRFPKRRQLGRNTVAWVDEEIDAWQRERAQFLSKVTEAANAKAA